MADAVLDFAGLESTAAGANTTDPDGELNLDGGETQEQAPNTETQTQDDTIGKTTEGGENKTEEGKTTEEQQQQQVTPTEATPDSIRKSLKGWRDADPKSVAVIKELHNAYERWNAAKGIFPTVKAMREAQEFITLVGGAEGYEALNSTIKAVEASDQKLYSGDPSLWDDVVEDLKNEGKLDSLGKLAPSFMDNLRKYDRDGYYDAFAPHFLSGVEEVKLPAAITAAAEALSNIPKDATPEQLNAAIASAAKIIGGMDKWYKDLKSTSDLAKQKQLDPERLKLNEDRKKLQAEQETFKTNQSKEFQTSVATDSMKTDNEKLGAELKPYLKLPFFKGFPRETLVDLAQGIKVRLHNALEADKTYQAQMKALWGAKNPDRAKILQYHKGKVDSIAADVVRLTIQQRYPSYAKGGSAQGRIAAKTEKVDAQKKADQKSAETGKPQYVAQKPAWDSIDWEKDPKQYLYVGGKAYLKGSGRFVTWRK